MSFLLEFLYCRIEIWDENNWEKYSNKNNLDADNIAKKLGEIGIF